MTFYFAMINAWSLAWDALNGTMDEEYPIINTGVGAGNTAIEDDGLDYEVDYMSSSADYLADIDDMYAHQFTTWDDGMSLQVKEELNMDYEPRKNHQYKYHEEEILKDIEEYVSRTYQGHYTGKSHEYRNVQTLDLMAAKAVSYTHLTLPTKA